MYMTTKANITSFEWNQGNRDKNYQKHGITTVEAEEIFLDSNLTILEDIKHSQLEPRLIAMGKTLKGKTLVVVYTHRESNVRIISARVANKKEQIIYEKT